VAMVAGLVLIVLGLVGYGESHQLWLVIAGFFILFASVMQITIMPLLLKIESTVARQHGEIRDLHLSIERQMSHLAAIAENTRISEAAKSLAHRDQEIEAFRAAILEDIRLAKWEAALKLVDDMEVRFGYKQEAEKLREELDEARSDAIQGKLQEAISQIEKHFLAHDWERAQQEIDRLANALPDETKIASLFDRMKALREQHKNNLREQWDESVRRSDVDQAIDILKELDQYLSPAEAQTLQDSARDVFKEKLLQLGVQFRFAVNEKRWQDALNIGVELVRDFPNARMAGEVREAIDTLRQRASKEATPT
jgi:soluble cytochrome b562